MDQADSALRLVQSEIERILAAPSGMSDLDRTTLKKVADDVSRSSIELLMLLDSLPDREKAGQIAEYITSAVMSAMIAGAASVFTPDAKLWFDTGKGHKANAVKVRTAGAKNQILSLHIRAEAAVLGISLSASEECAKRLLPGVLARFDNKPLDKDGKAPRGYGWTAIRRQIQTILSE